MNNDPHGKNNAVPLWVQRGPTIIELANNIGNLILLRARVDTDTQKKIDDLVTDLKTYVNHDVSPQNLRRANS